MITVLFLVVVIGLVVYAVFMAERDFFMAVILAFNGEHRQAIYRYAIAAVTSCFFKEVAREGIRSLWKKYGAFDYLEFYATFRSAREKEKVARHDVLMDIIKSSVNAE